MKNMSFAMTTEQVLNRSKSVTRRFGWWGLKAGDLVQPVVKGMGLKKGGALEKIGGPVRVVSVRRERLRDMTDAECVLEGFPELDRKGFVKMLCEHYGDVTPATLVNRIEFEYVEAAE